MNTLSAHRLFGDPAPSRRTRAADPRVAAARANADAADRVYHEQLRAYFAGYVPAWKVLAAREASMIAESQWVNARREAGLVRGGVPVAQE